MKTLDNLMFYLLLISCTSIQAMNKYIAKNGNDNNAGTKKAPYLNIQKGLNIAKSGDTVFVKTGTYQEFVQFPTSGRIGNPIVLKNFNNDIVTIDAQNIREFCIFAIDKSNLVMDGINIQNSKDYNLRIEGCDNIIIKNVMCHLPVSNVFGSTGAKGIVLSSSKTKYGRNITLQNINAIGGQYGILMGSRLANINIIGGRYSYASIDGINMQITSSAEGKSQFNRNIIVDGVVTDHNLRQGMVTMGLEHATFKNFWSHHNNASGLQIENYSTDILIENFICENNSLGGGYEAGLWIDDSDNVIVREGILRNNQCGLRVSNSQNVLAYNLLIYSNNYTKIPTDFSNNSAGISFYSNILMPPINNIYDCHVELYNSVIYDNSNRYSQRGTVDLEGGGKYILKNNIIAYDQSTSVIYRTGKHKLISDYNLIYKIKEVNINHYNKISSKYSGNKQISTYFALTGQDLHSLNADPQFTDPTSGNFKLQLTSPALKAGINVGLNFNYHEYPINGRPNIGVN